MTTAYENAYHVSQARLRGGLPSTDARFTDEKLLNLLAEELNGSIAPLVHNAKSEHGVVQYTVPVTVGTSEYQLPPNAFASTLRDVYWIDASNNITPLDPRSPADPLVYSLSRNNGTPRYYYLRGSRVAVVPPPGIAGTLAMPHYARPGRLVFEEDAPAIQIVAPLGGGLYSVAVADTAGHIAAFTRFAQTGSFNLMSQEPTFEILGSVAVVAGPDTPGNGLVILTVSSAMAPVPGNYACAANESPVPQCPVELFPLLHARAALVAVPSTGDMSQAATALAAQVADLEAKARAFLQPRVESGSPPPGKGLGSNPLLGVVSGSWGAGY